MTIVNCGIDAVTEFGSRRGIEIPTNCQDGQRALETGGDSERHVSVFECGHGDSIPRRKWWKCPT